jgi:hypothetical protein
LVILLGLLLFEKRQHQQVISRENYVNLENERSYRPRESTFKGIAMGDLKVIRNDQASKDSAVVSP